MVTRVSDKELPRWLLRRWRLLQAALIRKDFQGALEGLSEGYKANGNLPTPDIFTAFRIYGIPGECSVAFYALLENPALIQDEQTLVELIFPPISATSFTKEKRIPSANPGDEFKRWQEVRKRYQQSSNVDILEGEGLVIEVNPFTTKDELLGFVSDYFDEYLKPLLAGDATYTPEKLRAGRVTSPSKRKETIMELFEQGKSAGEIVRILRGDNEPSNIRKVISQTNKARKQK